MRPARLRCAIGDAGVPTNRYTSVQTVKPTVSFPAPSSSYTAAALRGAVVNPPTQHRRRLPTTFKFTRPLGQRLILAAAISDVLLLAACGGSAAAPTATAQGATAVYFTDDFSATCDAVWLSVSRPAPSTPSARRVGRRRFDKCRLRPAVA